MTAWKATAALPLCAILVLRAAQADEAPIDAAIDYPSVAAALEALRTDSSAQFESQAGWILVASSESDNPVLWSFTPEGHPAHPAVVKRTALEKRGTGFVELATLCQGPELECVALLDEFRQISQEIAQSNLARRVLLDVGIAQNEHDRVLVKHLLAEEGQAAEIRMDNLLKVVIVPSWDELRGVMLWAAMYEFDGRDFRLAAQPTIAAPGAGTALIDVAALSGDRFRFSITPLFAAGKTGL
jgi:hypothetical protein